MKLIWLLILLTTGCSAAFWREFATGVTAPGREPAPAVQRCETRCRDASYEEPPAVYCTEVCR